MKLFKSLLVVFALLSAPLTYAQEGYPNSCDPSDPGECFHLSFSYSGSRQTNNPFPEDPKRSLHLKQLAFEGALKGCEEGDIDHCTALGDIVFDPVLDLSLEQTGELVTLSIATIENACTNREFQACRMLSTKTSSGWPPQFAKENAELAQRLLDNQIEYGTVGLALVARELLPELEKKCAQNDADACADFGEAQMFSVENRNSIASAQIVSTLIDACLGDADRACDVLVGIFTIYASGAFSGQAEEAKIESLVSKLKSDCVTKSGQACALLGFTTFDQAERFKIGEMACDYGNARACRELGKFHYSSFTKTNDPKDLDASVSALSRACEIDDAFSCHMLEHISRG